ncbi:MAG: P-loop NTPase [Anaerolineae bacterium]|nr:P-loop NTPase [Anaerolineae bacterium]
MKRPTDPVSDSYHALCAHLLGAAGSSGRRMVVFTSADAGAGKSVTVGNVAVAMAEAGLRVLLVDADLRNPSLHQFFGLHNEVGLTTLLAADPPDPTPSPAPGLGRCLAPVRAGASRPRPARADKRRGHGQPDEPVGFAPYAGVVSGVAACRGCRCHPV